jgi:uncharacterized Zn-binding protein involved in type VI secretion
LLVALLAGSFRYLRNRKMSKQPESKNFHPFATVGARTEYGGRVTSGSGFVICGLPVACVGDIVTYADGSEAVITDGAGAASLLKNRPAALVGSRLSNGDKIIRTPWSDLLFGIPVVEGQSIPGLFDANWVAPPACDPDFRLAVFGATTARGGVLLKSTGNWIVPGSNRNAASVGDFVQYRDGSRARIVTGIGMADNPKIAYAIVGSRLDNGDVITDSPHREPRTSTLFVPVDEHGTVIAGIESPRPCWTVS